MIERLGPIETAMWRVGHDPVLRMTVGTIITLDRPPTPAVLAERLESVAAQEPHLHRLPDDPTRLRSRPAWVDEPTFDVNNHLRTMSLPSPASERQLLDLVALLESVPFDPDRSPWDVTLIDGLEGGRGALYLRAHHVLTDGFGGTWLIDLLFDESQVSARPSAEPASASAKSNSPVSSGRALTVTIDISKAMRPLKATLDIEPVSDVVVRGVQRSLDVANSVSRQVLVSGGPLSPLPPSRSMTSRFEIVSVAGARAASLALGGSRNDLLVAAAAAGLGRYCQRTGEPCPELRLVTPTNLRHGIGGGGNWFAPIRATVPTGTEHPGPHFGVVAERLARARNEAAVPLTAALASTVSRLPTRLVVPAMHAQAASVDFAVTTLPGFRGRRHIDGAVVERSYPLGPRLGCPLNITAFGNDDRLDVGVAIDPAAITEPEVLLKCIAAAFSAFVPNPGDDPVSLEGTKEAVEGTKEAKDT